jgi:hypothetical protein
VSVKIEHSRQERQGHEPILAARGQYARRTAQNGASNAETERVEPFHIGDVAHGINRFQWTLG